MRERRSQPGHPKRLSVAPDHRATYPRFLWRAALDTVEAGVPFYTVMTALTAIALVGGYGWIVQLRDGLVVTHMTDHVSWGLYIANFTFLVGLAAGGVMMVIPAYLYHDEDMHDVVILGELLAIAAVAMALMFVVADMGRPDRFWHMLPGTGHFNFPISMLTWDVIVLSGYLLLNLHVCGYLIYMRWLGRTPNPRWYIPFVLLSIAWAISIHTVTAFLYCGLGGRPLWNSALLAPRFLASAFVSGPAFIVITLQIVRRVSRFRVPEKAIEHLVQIVRITSVVNLFMAGSELFTELYTGGAHTASAHYLFFGMHGHAELVPWIWTALGLNLFAVVVLLSPASEHRPLLNVALIATFCGVWIEKGMGLIVPAFVPSPLHELQPYLPSFTEWQISSGIWAFGLMLYGVAVKFTVHTFLGFERWSQATPEPPG